MKIRTRSILFAAVMTCSGLTASAQQAPPFFGGGVVAYDPEVSVIQSGALLDTRATVSADRKYVTLDMRLTNSNVRSLQPFPVVAGPQGFVGGAALNGANAAPGLNPPADPAATAAPAPVTPARSGGRSMAARGNANAQAPANPNANTVTAPSPDALNRAAKSWILARTGMYLVKPLE
jgi:hypothetical protein